MVLQGGSLTRRSFVASLLAGLVVLGLGTNAGRAAVADLAKAAAWRLGDQLSLTGLLYAQGNQNDKVEQLLAGMKPRLQPGIFVFATVPAGSPISADVEPVMVFRESEGVTLVLEEAQARKAGLDGTFRSRLITLEIHSSLDAVGFLAAITARLAEAGMGVNPVSAFYHDHLFVAADRAAEALRILETIARDAAS